jgi:hypothetical protein
MENAVTKTETAKKKVAIIGAGIGRWVQGEAP